MLTLPLPIIGRARRPQPLRTLPSRVLSDTVADVTDCRYAGRTRPTREWRWIASGGRLVVVGAATFMLLLDVTIVIVALPEIQRGLHASFSDVQWVIDAYALTLASLLLTAGSLADRYG